MDVMKKIYILLICQGFYLGSVCQEWTFPSTVTALIGSCVEIPCTYHPARSAGTSSPVWYLYARTSYPEILNTKDSSSVLEKYVSRTSLVPGRNSCTLRIDPARRKDNDYYYYPGITDDRSINAYEKHSRSVYLDITDKVNVQLFVLEFMTEGEATILRCTAEHTCGSSPPSLQWNKPGQIKKTSVEGSEGTWKEQSELTYIPSYVDDRTPVQCTATYPNGQTTERSRMLNIVYAPKNVTVTIGMDEVMEGSDVRLQCNSFSNPDVYKYEWYKGKTKLPDRGREITVRNVTRDMKPYSCAARNRLGRGESDLTEIPVQYAAIGVYVTVKNKHELSELICDFLSSRPDVTHYTWMKNGSILQNETGKTLNIYNIHESWRQYSCIAHNSAGISSSAEINFTDETSAESFIENYRHFLLLATIGTTCLLLLPLLVYACWRKRQKKATSTEHEATYTDLRSSVNTNTYAEMKPVIPADSPVVKSEVGAANENEYV